MEEDLYFTIKQAAEAAQKIKSSRFIGRVFSISDRDAAEFELTRLRKREYDATHHCYAWRLGIGSQEHSRFSDDGEPAGTAGRPILQALLTAEVTDVLLVVTRYFGGIKLGTGGLARAYGQVAAEVVARAGRREVHLLDELLLVAPYELYGLVQHQVEKFGGKISESDFDQQVTLRIMVRKSLVEPFKIQIVDASDGRIKVEDRR
ncbi:MAG TPA: YigZ family protein [bacterium]|nr:YigZ family protein [bacterium]